MKYGGNTTCISVQCGDQTIIIDAGSGIRPLGRWLEKRGGAVDATMLFTHLHWDHIQGYPFFRPAFVKGNHFDLWSDRSIDGDLLTVLKRQFAMPTFPVSVDDLKATHAFHHVDQGGSFEIGDQVTVRTAPLNHPGGATAYRIDYGGRSFVHASDHEHTEAIWEPLRELAEGADFLSYDSTYTDEEYRGVNGADSHVGWGHSTWQEAVRMAKAAQVKCLVLTHHDPDHSDEQLDEIGAAARALMSNVRVAHEGMALNLLGG